MNNQYSRRNDRLYHSSGSSHYSNNQNQQSAYPYAYLGPTNQQQLSNGYMNNNSQFYPPAQQYHHQQQQWNNYQYQQQPHQSTVNHMPNYNNYPAYIQHSTASNTAPLNHSPNNNRFYNQVT